MALGNKPYPVVALADLGIEVMDCEHRTPEAQEHGYPYIAIPDLKDGRVDHSDARRISEEDFVEWTKKVNPQPGDILLTRRGRVGDTAVIPEGLSCALGQNLVLLRTKANQVEQDYLRWAVRSPTYWASVEKYKNVGSVYESLNVRDIRQLEIPVPPKPAQRKIAYLLGNLDDKVELNRHMNLTLEELARVIFRSWFVDFNLGHAKANGEEGEETAELFPEEFQVKQGDKIPEEWEISPISQHIEIITGGTPKTSIDEYWEGPHPWFSVKDAPNPSDVFVIDTERTVTDAGVENSSTEVMPQGTTIISARGTVGKLAVTGVPMAMNQSCYGIRGKNWGDFFTYFTLYHAVYELQQKTHGSVFDTITKKTFDAVDVVIPPEKLVKRFEELVEPLMQRILLNNQQNIVLRELRDLLLPKLISGELRVDDLDVDFDNENPTDTTTTDEPEPSSSVPTTNPTQE